jgi:formate-dependent nitrite reductase membrane component NrfD
LAARDVFAFSTIIDGGFAMNYVNGIALWNSALLPVLYAVSGIWGGAGIAMAISLATGTVSTLGVSVEEWIRILLASYVLLLFVYLVSVRYTSTVGRYSVRGMLVGKYWPTMWLVVLTIGLAFPVAVVVTSYVRGVEGMPPALLYVTILCELVGDLTMRYLILKQGMYAPLVPSSASPAA